VANVIASAKQTAGVPQRRHEAEQLRQYATLALAAFREKQQAGRRLGQLVSSHEAIARLAAAVGAARPVCCG